MNIEEKNYQQLLQKILYDGALRNDRTKTGTLSLFGTSLKFSLKNNTVPCLTTKKMFTKGVIEELLFFLRGETDTKKLEAKGVNIWKGNTSREFLDKQGLQHYKEGEMGPMYGNVWRDFSGVDQIKNALDLIKNDPNSRRIIVTAYDPSISHKCVLDPCHMFFQFYVNRNKLSLQFYMRSVDTFLGLPFNLLSYGILTHIMAQAANLEAGELIFMGGDTHIYNNHIDQARVQIAREPYDFPHMKITKKLDSITDIENLELNDFVFDEYQHHPAIKADMAI